MRTRSRPVRRSRPCAQTLPNRPPGALPGEETPGGAVGPALGVRRLRPHQHGRRRGGRHGGRGGVRGHPRLLAGGRGPGDPLERLARSSAGQEAGRFHEGRDPQEARPRARSHRAVRGRRRALVPAPLLRNVQRGVVPVRKGAAGTGHPCSWSSPTTTTSMPAR